MQRRLFLLHFAFTHVSVYLCVIFVFLFDPDGIQARLRFRIFVITLPQKVPISSRVAPRLVIRRKAFLLFSDAQGSEYRCRARYPIVFYLGVYLGAVAF